MQDNSSVTTITLSVRSVEIQGSDGFDGWIMQLDLDIAYSQYEATCCVRTRPEKMETWCLLADSALLSFVSFYIVWFYTQQYVPEG